MISGNDDWRSRLRANFEARKAAAGVTAAAVVVKRRRVKERPPFYGPPPPVGTILTVRVYGDPIPQPRPKARAFFDKVRRKWVAQVYDPDDAGPWKRTVREAFRPHLGVGRIANPVRVSIDFLMHRPKYLCAPWYARHAAGERFYDVTPDRDNLEKSTCDALTDAGLWEDDCLVCCGEIRKFYHSIGDAPGARVTVEVLAADPVPLKRRVDETVATLF